MNTLGVARELAAAGVLAAIRELYASTADARISPDLYRRLPCCGRASERPDTDCTNTAGIEKCSCEREFESEAWVPKQKSELGLSS